MSKVARIFCALLVFAGFASCFASLKYPYAKYDVLGLIVIYFGLAGIGLLEEETSEF